MNKVISLGFPPVVRNVSAIRQVIVDGLEDSDEIFLDIPKEDAADLCGLQLIESARRYAVASGKRLALLRPAEQLRPLLQDTGFLAEPGSELHQFWLHEGPS